MSDKLLIDKYNLDEECIQQPVLYEEAGTEAAQAVNDRDVAKVELDRCYAELDLWIREEAVENKEKLTNPQVDAHILTSPKYIEAQMNYLTKKKEASIAETSRDAFRQRGSMLELVVRLYLSEYFTSSSQGVSEPELLQKIGEFKIKKEVAEKTV